ncbi:hypothetical protein EG832_22750 [bacterium]|nr:hypothetical protein [bacterium]
MTLEYIEYKNGWAYRFKNKGRILVHSEAYDSKDNAERAAQSFIQELTEALNNATFKIEYFQIDEVYNA